MMTSFPENIATICGVIAQVNPKQLLDVGSGFGKYGLLARETLMAQAAERGDWTPKDELFAVCVEGAQFFHDLPYHKSIYNAHFHVDAKTLSTDFLKSFALTLMIDIAEHWPKQDVLDFVLRCGPVLVSTPKGVHMYTEEYYGKDCPKHQTQFSDWDFREGVNYSTVHSHIYLMNKAS